MWIISNSNWLGRADPLWHTTRITYPPTRPDALNCRFGHETVRLGNPYARIRVSGKRNCFTAFLSLCMFSVFIFFTFSFCFTFVFIFILFWRNINYILIFKCNRVRLLLHCGVINIIVFHVNICRD